MIWQLKLKLKDLKIKLLEISHTTNTRKCSNVQRDLDTISVWANNNGLLLNINKCKYYNLFKELHLFV